MRRIILLALAFAIVFPFFSVSPRAAAEIERGANAEHYVGPTWGFSLFWNPHEWDLVEERNEPGYDGVYFQSGTNQILIEGYAGFRGNAAECVNDQIATFRERDDISNLEVAAFSEEMPYETLGDVNAYTLYTLDYASENGSIRFGLYSECQTLVEEEAVLEITYLAEGEQFDAFANVADRVVGSIIYARSSLTLASNPIEDTSSSATMSRVGSATVDRFIARVATGEMAEPPPGYHYAATRVTFENTSDDVISANALTVYLSDEFDALYWSAYFRWDVFPGDATSSYQVLYPAEFATVTTFYLVPDDIDIASVHCACFSEAGYVAEPIKRLRARAGDVARNPYYKQTSVMFDMRGNERGLITFGGPVVSRQTSSDPYEFMFTFENTGRQTLVVDPERVIAFARDGYADDFSTVLPASFEWEWGPGDLNEPTQELAPGDRAIVFVRMSHVPQQYAVGYMTSEGQLVPVAVGCTQCAGGLGRPSITRRG